MAPQSITQIRALRDSLREKIKGIDRKAISDQSYGGESEYSYKGLLGGIEALLTDISALTRAPSQFVKISTTSERQNIVKHLQRIDSYIQSPTQFLPQFEALKVLLRSYNVRFTAKRFSEFSNEIESVRKLKIELEEELKKAVSTNTEYKDETQLIEAEVQSVRDKLKDAEVIRASFAEAKNNLDDRVQELSQKIESLNNIKIQGEENAEAIAELLTESKTNEKLIQTFAANIQAKEDQLAKLQDGIKQNQEKLEEYEKERTKILNEATSLIASAKQALNYKTAEGISASFQEQYVNSNSKWVIGGWIAGASVCLLITIALGVWILANSNDPIGVVVGRISLLPLPIVGAVFCANQYTKQKNIIEDYAYKMTLSKAIVGFSEQLKKHGSENNEEYIHYIKTALEEIHKDPLRKRQRTSSDRNLTAKETNNMEKLVSIAERIVKISKLEN